MDISDDTLIRDFVDNGDKAAFTALVERHLPGIRRILYAVLNGNRDDMLDTEQEVLLGLYKSLHRFGFRSTFRTWLYTFTRNRAIDHLRKITRQKRLAERLADGLSSGLALVSADERTTDPETYALNSVEDARAVSALQNLKEEQRTLVMMKDIENLSIAEIAQITGLASGTVKSRLHRARAKVAKIMEGGEA